MTQNIIRKRKWFWPWQDQQIEGWLEAMSHKGYHLSRVHPISSYEFSQGESRNYAYRLDFQDGLKRKNRETYLSLFSDAGWEYLGEMAGWQYFRKLQKPGEDSELYTDNDTKIQKYNRYLTYLGVVFPSYLVVFVALWSSWPEWMMWLNIAVILLFAAYSLIVSVKISQRIKQLKQI